MKKLILFTSLLAIPFLSIAQDEEKEAPKDGWTKAGNASFIFNQAAFNAE